MFDLKSLKNKTDELEQEIFNLNEITENISNTNKFASFNKNLTSQTLIETKQFLITSFFANKQENLHMQALVELNLNSSQNIQFSIIINNLSIFKTKKFLQSGFNQLTLIFDYLPLSNENIDIYIQITPLDGKEISLNNVLLSVWGIEIQKDDFEYQIISTSNNYIISFLDNKCLFILKTEKVNGTYNIEDFAYFKPSKSYSFSKLTDNEDIYLFRVDPSGNLFYSNIADQYETFVDNNVSKVSSASNNSTILVSYIKNNLCYYFEFNGKISSVIKQINWHGMTLSNTYCFYNDIKKNFSITVTDINNENYLIESQTETTSASDNISASVDISISTYTKEVEDELSLP